MRRFRGYHTVAVLPDDLIALAWSEPMRDLAAKVGKSDVGLKKLLASYGVVAPPQGYWNKVLAGKPVPKRPKAPVRIPGERGRWMLDPSIAELLPPAEPISSSGPFASSRVPEDLDELFAIELAAIGNVVIPARLDRTHPGLAHVIKKEQRRREKAALTGCEWDKPKFDGPLDQRRLRILNGIFLALAKRGHDGDAYERNGELIVSAIIGDMSLALVIDVANERGKYRSRGGSSPIPDLPAKTPLALIVDSNFNGEPAPVWSDDADGKLETKVSHIVARLIVLGEAKFRRRLREDEEWSERQRIREEEQRLAELAKKNQDRLEQLHESAELLRQAENLRSLVFSLRHAISDGRLDIDPETIAAWELWALAEADRIDPVCSGQVMSHIKTPC